MYAAIRQVKAKPGTADQLADRIKDAVPIVSGVSGFMGYYVVYAPDDTVTAISIFNKVEEAEEFEPPRARLDRKEPRALRRRTGYRDGGTRHRAFGAVAALGERNRQRWEQRRLGSVCASRFEGQSPRFSTDTLGFWAGRGFAGGQRVHYGCGNVSTHSDVAKRLDDGTVRRELRVRL